MTNTQPERAVYADNDGESPSLFTDEVKELVAIGAAVAGNCDRCFTHHYEKAKELGISDRDMLKAATLGARIREAPSKALSDLVSDRLNRARGRADARSARHDTAERRLVIRESETLE